MKNTINELLSELSLKSFHGINEKNEDGNTILHLAAQFSSYKTVKLLIEKGAEINAKNAKGETPLHRAAYRGKVRNVKEIVKAGGDVNARDNDGSTPLHYAAMLGSRGNIKGAIKELIKGGAEINAQNNKQRTPLLEAVYIIKDIESIKALIQGGSDVNLADDNGHTALHYASMGNDEKVVEMLIQAGANTNAVNVYGLKPIFYAEMRNKEKIVEVLKGKRERKNLSEIGVGYKNVKPRDVYKEMLKEIESKSYEGINEKNKDGETVLHLAVSYGSEEKIKELIEKGADVNIEDNKGRKALHYAALFGKTKTVKVLIKKGANINATDNSMYVPLHLACLTGKKGTVKELIKAGCNVNAVDKFGHSPLYYARNKTELVKLLEKKDGKVIDKSEDIMSGVENIFEGVIDTLDRLTLPELQGKILNLDEVKKRDKSLISKDWIKLRKKSEDLMNEITSLQNGLDEEKD
jgi:ankyrin repeat protein